MTDSELTAVLDPNSLAPDAADPPVATIMRDEVDFCLPSTPIDAVAKLMADNTLSEIVVLLDRRPVGYVRQEDVVDRLGAYPESRRGGAIDDQAGLKPFVLLVAVDVE